MLIPLRGISSMATRAVLADLAAAYQRQTTCPVRIESVGGVDAAKRVQSGETFDVVLLASDAIDKLLASGHARAGTRVDLFRSEVAVAVPAGAQQPDISSEDALKAAVLAAPHVGYSTGPSGAALLKLFERWGIATAMQARTVQAPPGVPVGSLIAAGKVALGFQQYTELKDLPGITVLGTMPPPVRISTIFSGATCASSQQPDAARDLLAFLASPATARMKQRHGLQPA
jgi:molybdate transport system substrate-binding protein